MGDIFRCIWKYSHWLGLLRIIKNDLWSLWYHCIIIFNGIAIGMEGFNIDSGSDIGAMLFWELFERVFENTHPTKNHGVSNRPGQIQDK